MTVDLRENLIAHVRVLAEEIGTRSFRELDKLERAATYIEGSLRGYGIETTRQEFSYEENAYHNIIGEVRGTGGSDEILVIGAHYDTVVGSPGADDNASAVAGMLELARLTAQNPMPLTVKFVAFNLEEPPVFMSSRMGSLIYAESLKKDGVKVRGMVSLEMIGYYTDEPHSQFYPLPGFRLIYPDRGNFIAFVGNIASRKFTKEVKSAFMKNSSFPVESINTVSLVPGVDFSDHRSFWKCGYPAFMITDTAFFRNPHYHAASDLPRFLDDERMAELVLGLFRAFGELT
jgi:Zn-dependent M28 family amino/carboxypeptidase